jgi:hypothetical protein
VDPPALIDDGEGCAPGAGTKEAGGVADPLFPGKGVLPGAWAGGDRGRPNERRDGYGGEGGG